MAWSPALNPPIGGSDFNLVHHPITSPKRQMPMTITAARTGSAAFIYLHAHSPPRPWACIHPAAKAFAYGDQIENRA